MHQNFLLLIFLSLFSCSIFAQTIEAPPGANQPGLPEWAQILYGENPDPETVIAAYEAYYKTHEFTKNGHTQYYKHWIRTIAQEPTGVFTGVKDWATAKKELAKYTRQKRAQNATLSPTSQWECIGPYDYDQEAASRSYAPGAAHVYTIKKAPSNGDIFYCGTSDGGVFKSTNHGANWTLMTRDYPITDVVSLEIDPNNADIVYLEGGGSVYKTSNGGTTWNTIGDAAFQATAHQVDDFVAYPGSSQVFYICAEDGLYRTADAGANWVRLMAGEFQEIEFQPGNPQQVYCVSRNGNHTEFFKSIDGGITWTQKFAGWPGTNPDGSINLAAGEEQGRVELAVTPAEPDYVYALATGNVNGGSGLFGVYKSTDGGENWTFSCCGPQPGGAANPPTNINMMGWQPDGSDDGGQYYYDLAFDVSPADADLVHVGGVNHWVSTDGGNSFTCPSKWSEPAKPSYVHADIHDIRYYPGEIWIACDGGIYVSTDGGTNFDRSMVGIEGTNFWGFGAGFSDTREVIVGGTYHNGTLLKDNDVYDNDWLCLQGGDNVRGYVNGNNNTIFYDDGGKKEVSGDRTIPITNLPYTMRPNASYIVGQTSNIAYHPGDINISFMGVGTVLWKSLDNDNSYTALHDFGAGNEVGEIRVSPSDPNTIYLTTFGNPDRIWRTTDGGVTWTDIKPLTSNVAYSITVSADNAQEIWAARTVAYTSQGVLNGSKVYKSTNGGDSWSNITGSALNGAYLTCILHQEGTDGGIYVGTRKAVYYKNEAMSDFVIFNNNLPAITNVTDMVANYLAGKLYIGTSRSAYKVDFYETSKPISRFVLSSSPTICAGDPVQLQNQSVALTGATYNWSFPTGTPTSSNLKNPVVTFNTAGNHSVSLTVTDVNGTDTEMKMDFLTTNEGCDPETVPGMTLSTNGSGSSFAYAADNDNLDFGSSGDFTVTTWIKTTSNSNDAVVVCKKDWDRGIHKGWVIAIENGDLWVNAGDGTNRVDVRPSDNLNDGMWHHVAATFERTGNITVYLDGFNIGSGDMSGVGNLSNANRLTIGADDEMDYPLAADIEELSIFGYALSQEEIRESRHLTKNKNTAGLISYYQFNESAGGVLDRSGGGNHLTLTAAATRSTSTSPVGSGVSQTLTCNSAGEKDFDNADLRMTFPAGGSFPNGDLVVSRLDLSPDKAPDANTVMSSYWVVNNYGTNSNFSELENIVFSNIGNIQPATAPSSFQLFKRSSNADGDSWGTALDTGDDIVTGPNSQVSFSAGNNITSFSQLVLSANNSVLPIELLDFSAQLNNDKEIDLIWRTASETDNDYFIIEKSRDGTEFRAMEKIPSQGDSREISSYRTIDRQPNRGINYYRLKQVDLDGSFTYSKIVSITLEALAYDLVVYPNPIAKGQELVIASRFAEDLDISIVDATGKVLITSKIGNGNGTVGTEALSSGVYYYQIRGARYLKNGVFVVE